MSHVAKCSKCSPFLCSNSDRTWFFNALTCQVLWEVVKTAAFGLGFQHLPRELVNVNPWSLIPILQYLFTVPVKTHSESIEDIVPFPVNSGATDQVPRTASSSSSNSDETITDTLNESSCQLGTCSYQQRKRCAGLLRFVPLFTGTKITSCVICMNF